MIDGWVVVNLLTPNLNKGGNKMDKKVLMKKYGIKSVGGGKWGEGFFDCLKQIDKKNIDLFKNTHTIKRILFAQKNNLPYDWLLNQLRNDYKRKIGTTTQHFHIHYPNTTKKPKRC